jgi:hypothetical protein
MAYLMAGQRKVKNSNFNDVEETQHGFHKCIIEHDFPVEGE